MYGVITSFYLTFGGLYVVFFFFSFIIFTLQVKTVLLSTVCTLAEDPRVISSCRLHMHTGWQRQVLIEFPFSFQDPWLYKCGEWKHLSWQPKTEKNSSETILSLVSAQPACPTVLSWINAVASSRCGPSGVCCVDPKTTAKYLQLNCACTRNWIDKINDCIL